jgi:putative endonuclease
MHTYWVYITASRSRVLYIGFTCDLVRRMYEHRESVVPGFTTKYKVNRLVHFEQFNDAMLAIEREKQLKGWLREKKIRLIEERNPSWRDLYSDIAGL